MDIKNFRIVLASQSPRRKELLEQAGFSFTVIPSNKKEIITKTIPSEVVMELAQQKAEAVFDEQLNEEPASEHVSLTEDIIPTKKPLIVIGADTVVALNNEILGKPADDAEAFEMLRELSDQTHKVYTGVSFYIHVDDLVITHTFYESTKVSVLPISDEEISDYIATGDPLDKAGSYGIQGRFAVHINNIIGDYNNVVGLPISRVYQELKKIIEEL